MLFLLFHIGTERYALEARTVREVVPHINLRSFPHAPRSVMGAFNYHQEWVPVLDLALLLLGKPSERCLSTRIVIVPCHGKGSTTRLLGLIAERATETIDLEPASFANSFLEEKNNSAGFGPVARDARGFIQRVLVEELLSPELRQLFLEGP